jgi:prevent-host-death family protein
MVHISATELNKRPGTYLAAAIREPIIIEKTGQPSVVLVSYDRYEELEDAYWGELATEADKEKSLGTTKTMKFLKGDD